ncbi:deoxyribonuclease-2-alpha-like [Denticeps clupeoides]|uniref:deoxyribonuclease-2-alpha-like n=1 Tax=Denticeps clupeoides TaxID=299321 RepID=UPI0010A50902|nr:deoxyribonuclease-2-alpha-like [Denticeps clupeoides]
MSPNARLRVYYVHYGTMPALALLPLLLLEGGASQLSCYEDSGDAVDWFYLYKLPHNQSDIDGLKYLLMSGGDDGWVDGNGLVNETTGALGRTVGHLYENGDYGYILYNDQPPEPMAKTLGGVSASSSSGGHTKGVVLFDKSQGFWLVHSTPHFPPPKSEGQFSYPSSGVVNGQNFICVTYALDKFQTIGEQLKINQPHVYDCHVPESLSSYVPSLVHLCKKNRRDRRNATLIHTSPTAANRSVALTTLAGTDFISFAKGPSFSNDLYHSWVAPTLLSNLLVQFWHRSTGILPSDCSNKWKVLNVQLVSPGQRCTFSTMDDHSKWAVSAAAGGSSGGWVCVGDINRNQAEERRGGGTVCRQDPVVWKAYRMAALECESCEGEIGNCGAEN